MNSTKSSVVFIAFLFASVIGLIEAIAWIVRGIPHSPDEAILYLAYASLGYGILTLIAASLYLLLSRKREKKDDSSIGQLFCIPIVFFLFSLFISFLKPGRIQLLIFIPASLALSILICQLLRRFIFSRLAGLFSLQRMLLFHLIALGLGVFLISILFDVGAWEWVGIVVSILAIIFSVVAIFSQRLANNSVLGLLNVVIIICLLLMFFIHPGAGNADLPRIILITIDTLRPDHLGCYGNANANTPNIDQISDRGTQFNRAISPSPRTGPSHISILTGLYPKHHGAIDNGDLISDGVITLPEILSAKGYTTAAFVSGWTLKNEACGLRSRFDLYEENFSSWKYFPESIFKIRLYMAFITIAKQFIPEPFKIERPAAQTTDAVIRWLKSHQKEPFFLWVHYYDPHVPYDPPQRFREESDKYLNIKINPNWWHWSRQKREELVADTLFQEKMISYYNGEISYVDEQIGRLFKEMEDLNLTDNLIRMITADHGESLGEHNYYYGHDDLYDVCLHVPLIIELNGQHNLPKQVNDPVRLIDLTPTLMDVLGIDETNLHFDGRSVLSNFENPQSLDTGKLFAALFEKTEMYCIRYRQHKLIWTAPNWNGIYRIPEKEELYDLQRDPGEKENILGSKPIILSELRNLLAEYKKEKVKVPTELTNEVKKRLRSLGYIK